MYQLDEIHDSFGSEQGVTKRCRLSWQTKSALVNGPNQIFFLILSSRGREGIYWKGGGGVRMPSVGLPKPIIIVFIVLTLRAACQFTIGGHDSISGCLLPCLLPCQLAFSHYSFVPTCFPACLPSACLLPCLIDFQHNSFVLVCYPACNLDFLLPCLSATAPDPLSCLSAKLCLLL
jgi:hypothetical protein